MYNSIEFMSFWFVNTIVFGVLGLMRSFFAFCTGKKLKRYIPNTKTPAIINSYDEGFMDTPAFLRLRDK